MTTTKPKPARKKRAPLVVGWQEWVGLPELGVADIKAKIDTGARTSAIHAYKVREITVDGEQWVRFYVHPIQRQRKPDVLCKAKISGRRKVRSSNGQVEERYLIETRLSIGGRKWRIELTLTNRDEMGFRMLIGRQALRRKALVDPAKSYLTGEPA